MYAFFFLGPPSFTVMLQIYTFSTTIHPRYSLLNMGHHLVPPYAFLRMPFSGPLFFAVILHL